MTTFRLRPVAYFAAGIAVTVASAWSLSAWRASAAVSADESTFVAVTPTRILDTREDIGLPGPFVSPVGQDLRVTGAIPTKSGTLTLVPNGATGVMLNVTVVSPSAGGFLSVRPANATGPATTSNLNFTAGQSIPNAVTVQVPTSGTDAGKIEITYNAFEVPGPTAEILVDLVGYTKNAGLASLQAQVNTLQTQLTQIQTALGGIDVDDLLLNGDAAGGALQGTYPSPGLASNSVTATQIAANAVGGSEIANGAVGTADLADDAVTATKIADNAVGLAAMNAVLTTADVTPGPIAEGVCAAPQDVSNPDIAGTDTAVLLYAINDGMGAPVVNFAVQVASGSVVAGGFSVDVCNIDNDGVTPDDPGTITVSYIAVNP